MGDDGGGEKDKERARSESEIGSSESDLTRSDSLSSAGPDLDAPESKRLRIDSDLESPEVRRIQDDLLNILDDPDGVADRDPAIQGLDVFIKSFEDEILAPSQPPEVLDLAACSAEAQTELGYLLEASDDELGLPPSFGSSEEDERKNETPEPPVTSSASLGFNDSLGFENDFPNYDSFENGICDGTDFSSDNRENDGQFVTLGGFSDFVDDGYDGGGGGGGSELLWRPESLPAI